MEYTPSERIKQFFDKEYSSIEHYWWLGNNRYDLEPTAHTQMNAMLLNLAKERQHGKALDLGAGEGADAIRLAKLGFSVTAVELSSIGAKKIERFAKDQGVTVTVLNKDISSFKFEGWYDIIICHGVLHYIQDKLAILHAMKAHTVPGGINSISCFTNFTAVPECHQIIPVFPDREKGEIQHAYIDWAQKFFMLERNVEERSHKGFNSHMHSFIKMIACKPNTEKP